jgi:ADP-heptose:LPS heptosyltransferase
LTDSGSGAAGLSIEPQGACLVRCGGIGDDLIAASTLPLLKVKYGRADVISEMPQGVVFHNNPYIDRLHLVTLKDLPKDAIGWQDYFKARGRDYALFVNLSHSVEVLRAMQRGQTQFYWPAEWRRAHCGRSYLESTHDICGVAHEFGPLFFPTDAERTQAAETRRKYCGQDRCIGWVLGGTRIDKVYPQTPSTVARLIRECDAHVMMFGAPGRDLEVAREVEKQVGTQNGSIDGLHLALSPDKDHPTWPIRRCLAQAMACDLMIGPDTGPMWAVAMERVPKIMLLGHASAENITKHWRNAVTLHADAGRVPCYPCHQLHDSIDTCRWNASKDGAACISDISAEVLLQTARRLLDGPDGRDE